MASSTQPRYGVRLTLPGASGDVHDIPGLHIPLRGDGAIVPLETPEDVARARGVAETADIEVVPLKASRPRKHAARKRKAAAAEPAASETPPADAGSTPPAPAGKED